MPVNIPRGLSNMADINLYPENDDDNLEDGYGLDDGIDSEDAFGTDDNLTPLQKLEKYMESDNVYTRQMVARGLLDTLRAVGDSEEQTTAVLTAMVRLSEDSDPIVRSELMEQVPHIAVYCQENKYIFENSVPVYILPMVVRYLNDANNQVRKTSQAALLVLLEQDLVEKADIEEQVVNVILELASPDSLDDYRTEAVALMSKMALLVGRDMTERLFLSRFCEMCCDRLFHVRKVCAANFGDLCTVISQASAEQQMLPKFYYLCEDGVWGVRKACAECFMSVSCACSPDVRKTDLAGVFVSLLCDQSRWVRMAAFQQLGPFISTFADSDHTGIQVAEDGSLRFTQIIKDKIKAKESKVSESDSCFVPEDKRESESSNGDQVVPESSADQSTRDTSSGEEKQSTTTTNPKSECVDVNSNTSACSSPDTPASSPESSQEQVCDIQYSQGEVEEMELEDLEDNSNISQSDSRAESGSVSTDDVVIEELSAEEKRAEHYTSSQSDSSTVTEAEPPSANEDKVSESTESDSKELAASEESSSIVEVTIEEAVTHVDITEEDIEQTTEDQSTTSQTSSSSEDVQTSTQISTEETSSADKTETSSSSSGAEAVSDIEQGNVHIQNVDTSDVNNFDSFLYWRTPILEVNIEMELVQGAATRDGSGSQDQRAEPLNAGSLDFTTETIIASTGALSDSVSDLTICDTGDSPTDQTMPVTITEAAGVVSTSSNADELSSANLLGQMMGETSIVDGIVQGVEDINLGYIDSNLLLSLLPIADLSGTNMAYIDSDFSTSPHSSLRESLTMLDDATLAQQQDIVPQSLLENYLGMIDPSRAQTVDTEITKYCAYNLPAVAYTLGRENWHCIKNLYDTLAADMQWKVRRTLAFSIHELAVILGEDITQRDLVPVFDGFLKDLDEVRIGILRHLADFLRLLSPEVRRQYLIKVQDFMNIDNQRNWRFRLELAEQLVLISELFSAQEISEYLLPLAMALADDKVAEVRIDAFRLVSVMLRRLSDSQADNLVQFLVNQLISRFAQNHKWGGRQIFAQLCQAILQEEAVNSVQFARSFLPVLMRLKEDSVPNVRIALAKAMAVYATSPDYFNCDKNPHREELLKTLESLRTDTDRDVRFFSSAGQYEYSETTSIDSVEEDVCYFEY